MESTPGHEEGSPREPIRFIAYAYSATPDHGSEHAVGWTWSHLLAGLGEVWVLKRPAEGDQETAALRTALVREHDRLHFVDVAPPGWLERLPSGRRGELYSRLEYMAWQFEALKVARELHRAHRFDIAWHLTWSTAWLGSTLSLLGVPFVFGPVGGGVEPPWRLAQSLGGRGLVSELQRTTVRSLARHLNPLAHRTWRRARLILAQNPETKRWLPANVQSRCVVFPNAILDPMPPERSSARPRTQTALFAGRLIPLKGVSLALRVLAVLPGWRLIICGSGVDEPRLKRQARELRIEERVEFRGMRTRAEVLQVMREEADVLLFPSFHDEGSLAVAEAVATGLPVVCLDRGGPPTLGGRGVRVGSTSETVARLAASVQGAHATGHVPHPPFDLETRRRDVADLLDRVGLLPKGATGW